MTSRPSTASRPGRRHQSGTTVGSAADATGCGKAVIAPSVAEAECAHRLQSRPRPGRAKVGIEEACDGWIAPCEMPWPNEARPEAPDHPASTRRFRSRGPLDLAATLAPLRHGTGDPTIRIRGRLEVLRATLTPEGPTTEHLRQLGDEVEVEAWGPGAGWALEHAPDLVGEHDDATAFHPVHPVLTDLARRLAGVRLCRSDAAFEALVPAVLEQKITGLEAVRVRRRMALALGEPAPGPAERLVGLRLPPSPERLASLAYYDLHSLGLERRRAEVIIRLRRERPPSNGSVRGNTRMPRRGWSGCPASGPGRRPRWLALPGRSRRHQRRRLSPPEPGRFALAGEPRGDDARMLELLEPYRGQRGTRPASARAVGHRAPRYGPHMPTRAIEGM